jgi:hypothetical protein
MEFEVARKTGNGLAEYYVYFYGEGEHYVSIIQILREAQTRSSMIESINYAFKVRSSTFEICHEKNVFVRTSHLD